MSPKILTLTLSTFLTSALIGCNQGTFQAASLEGPNSNNQNGQGQTPGGSTPSVPKEPTAFDKLELSGTVTSTSYTNETVIGLDKENLTLLLYLPLPSSSPFSQIYIDVPEVKGVQIKTILDNQQKARVAVSIPLRLLFKDKVALAAANALPDGRDLPMMPSGEYPSLGLSLFPNSAKNLHLYFGVNTIGMYFRSSFFPEFLSISSPIKNAAQTRTLGYFTIVPKKGSSDGGLFLAFILPNDIAAIIDDHLSGIID